MTHKNKISLSDLFLEYSTTDSPFEKWKLYKFFSPSDAMLVYMPGQKQSGLCLLQELLYEKMKASEKEASLAKNFMQWLTSHRNHLLTSFGSCQPADFWNDLSYMTTGELKNAEILTNNIFLVFNMQSVYASR